MENMNNEIIETTEVELIDVDTVDVDMEESVVAKGSGFKKAAGVTLVLAGVAALGKFVWDKTEAYREERTIAKYEKIMAKREAAMAATAEEEFVEGEVIDTEETNE
jgi:hypothetical protein